MVQQNPSIAWRSATWTAGRMKAWSRRLHSFRRMDGGVLVTADSEVSLMTAQDVDNPAE